MKINKSQTTALRKNIFSNFKIWIWTVIVFSILVCLSISWIHISQKKILNRSVYILENIRQARIDLAKGFLHIQSFREELSPYDRNQGIALIQQAIPAFQESLRWLNDEPLDKNDPSESKKELLENFKYEIDKFSDDLNRWMNDTSDEKNLRTKLRISLNDLELRAEFIDSKIHADLLKLSSEYDNIFLLTLMGAALLLCGICIAVVFTVKEKLKYERDLMASEQFYKTTLYSIGDGVITTDKEGMITQMNNSAQLLSGWNEAEVIGKPVDEIFRIINESTKENVESPVHKVLQEGMIVGLANHTLLIKRDGTEIHIADSGAPIKNEAGEIEGVVLVFRDKTEEQKALQLVRQSEEKMRMMVEGTPYLFFYTQDEDANLTYISPSVEKITGHKVEDWFNTKDWFTTNSEINQIAKQKTRAKLKGENIPGPIFVEIKHAAGNNILLEIYENPIYRNNALVGLQGIAHDITERVRLEKERIYLQEIIQKSLNEIYIFDADTLKFEFANRGAVQNLGYTVEELKSLTPYDIKPEFTKEKFLDFIEPLVNGTKDLLVLETFHERKNGSRYHVNIHLQLHKLENKRVFLAIINDISDRKKAEKEIRESEARFRTTLYSIGDGVIATDENGLVTQLNPIAEALTGWNETDAAGKPLTEIFKIINEDTRQAVENPVEKVLREGKIVGLANHTLLISKSGTEVPIADSGAPIRNPNGGLDGVVLVFRDQTNERDAQTKILSSLTEKEILLKEIHHRVKNNFQRIISLIGLQTAFISDQKILEIFEELQSRLRSMSLIHELMYSSDNFSGVDIKRYIEKLTEYLIQTYSSSAGIELKLDLESHNLDLDSIIPCGLIINEIITNSLKYAFPVENKGVIAVSLKKVGDEFFLKLSDNGVGLKSKIDFKHINSLGIRLVDLLVKQLKGTLEVLQPEKGIEYRIKFKGDL